MKVLVGSEYHEYEIPPSLAKRCEGMNVDPAYYIEVTEQTFFVSVECLILSRVRPRGLANAVQKMKQAALGMRPKRRAILVERKDARYLVIDGNSTTVVLAALSSPTIPVSYW
jgi:hypothetical protein